VSGNRRPRLGSVAWAELEDANGFRKLRPVVVITPTASIARLVPIAGVFQNHVTVTSTGRLLGPGTQLADRGRRRRGQYPAPCPPLPRAIS
jgi:hypothetical protein